MSAVKNRIKTQKSWIKLHIDDLFCFFFQRKCLLVISVCRASFQKNYKLFETNVLQKFKEN